MRLTAVGLWGWYGAAVMRLLGLSLTFFDGAAGKPTGHGASTVDHGVRSKSSKPAASDRTRPVSPIAKTDRRDLDRKYTTPRGLYGARLRSEWRMMKEPENV